MRCVESARTSTSRMPAGDRRPGAERGTEAGAGDGAGLEPRYDSGEVEVLEDGALSIPVLEEEAVVTKRWVVRERIIVRKGVTTERHTVNETVRREVVDIDGSGGRDGDEPAQT
jgi:stress response protein YsnF